MSNGIIQQILDIRDIIFSALMTVNDQSVCWDSLSSDKMSHWQWLLVQLITIKYIELAFTNFQVNVLFHL